MVLRQLIIDAVDGGYFSQESLTQVLVEVLEDETAGLRAAAASALSRMGTKRTIVNPAFWQHAPSYLREREIGEWKLWLEDKSEG